MSVRSPPPVARAHSRRELVATSIANAIEWYDFAVYGALASVLVVVLLPGDETGSGLVAIFAVFATSFLARPVGALVVGRRADRIGRRRMLAAMILLMSTATAAIGLLPTWSAVGVAGPTCLVLLRLLQGFSSGGEVTTSIPFLAEFAPDRRWGWYCGWHTATMAIGIAAGLAIAGLLSAGLSDADMERWGWRAPFLVALPLGGVGLYVGLRLRETPPFEAASGSLTATTLRGVWRAHRPAVWSGFVLVGVLTGTFNMWFVFLPAHLAADDIHPLSVALATAVCGLLATAVAAPALGRLSDRVGRRPVLLFGTSALCLLAVPLYLEAVQGSRVALLLANLVVGALLGALVVSAHIAERFPVGVRASGVALTYGVSSALLGGTAPLLGSVLAERGLAIGAPIYLSVLGGAGAVAALRAPAPVSRTTAPAEGDAESPPPRHREGHVLDSAAPTTGS
jgi:MHS family proline/betaine transporter-like MFS transporter